MPLPWTRMFFDCVTMGRNKGISQPQQQAPLPAHLLSAQQLILMRCVSTTSLTDRPTDACLVHVCYITQECHRELMSHNTITCPLCLKCILPPEERARMWRYLDSELRDTPMPEEYQGVRVRVRETWRCVADTASRAHTLLHHCSSSLYSSPPPSLSSPNNADLTPRTFCVAGDGTVQRLCCP